MLIPAPFSSRRNIMSWLLYFALALSAGQVNDAVYRPAQEAVTVQPVQQRYYRPFAPFRGRYAYPRGYASSRWYGYRPSYGPTYSSPMYTQRTYVYGPAWTPQPAPPAPPRVATAPPRESYYRPPQPAPPQPAPPQAAPPQAAPRVQQGQPAAEGVSMTAQHRFEPAQIT